jgi:hypothetical protein
VATWEPSAPAVRLTLFVLFCANTKVIGIDAASKIEAAMILCGTRLLPVITANGPLPAEFLIRFDTDDLAFD